MSLINEYRTTEAAIKKLQDRLQALQQDDKLQKELEFETRLRELMAEYGKALPDILALLDAEGKVAKAGRPPRAEKTEAPTKRTRKVKQYQNPHTGETIQTKGGNHKTLKEWKATWGNETVESWATILD
ncbi:DNA binding protein [Pseudomonas stutzeri]|nr:DNA binding protein [Stutzerimonas stutzeri]